MAIPGLNSRTEGRVFAFCIAKGIDIITTDHKKPCPKEYIPCGGVEWCELTLGQKIIPDYYPEWATDHLHRMISTNKHDIVPPVFVKPRDSYKRFTGRVIKSLHKKPKGTLIFSEVVQFTNEGVIIFRQGKYYVVVGIKAMKLIPRMRRN